MSSIAETKRRSKKTTRLGPMRVIRPEQYEAFDVNSKVECIQALIPLGLMRIQELLENEVGGLGHGMNGRRLGCRGTAMGVIPGVSGWQGNGIHSRSLASSTWGAEKCPYRVWRTSEELASWMRSRSIPMTPYGSPFLKTSSKKPVS